MTRYITGLFDEHEFDRQLPPHHGFVAHGPYDTIEKAQAKARTLSTDPDEAVVVELETEGDDLRRFLDSRLAGYGAFLLENVPAPDAASSKEALLYATVALRAEAIRDALDAFDHAEEGA